MNVGPFHKSFRFDHRVKLWRRDKKVLAAVFFLATGRACGVGDRGVHMRIEFSQGFDKARFARTTGGGHNEQVSGVIHGNQDKTVKRA